MLSVIVPDTVSNIGLPVSRVRTGLTNVMQQGTPSEAVPTPDCAVVTLSPSLASPPSLQTATYLHREASPGV